MPLFSLYADYKNILLRFSKNLNKLEHIGKLSVFHIAEL